MLALCSGLGWAEQVPTCSIHVAGLRPSGMGATPGMPWK